MNTDYVAEILRATGSVRAGDPAGVTAIIQNATRINTERGERWFCSEDEAIAAGWRAPVWR